MIFLLLLGCETEPEETFCSEDPPLSWENFGKGHLRTHCNGCHGVQLRPEQRNFAPIGVDFDTYPLAEEYAERIYLRTLISRDMPPLGGPTEQELIRFEQWVVCELLDGEVPE